MSPRSISFSLPYAPPLDWAFFLRYLGGRATAGVEVVTSTRYARAVAVGADVGIVTVSHHAEKDELCVTLRGIGKKSVPVVGGRIREIFDLDADLAAVQAVLGYDPWLGPLLQAAPGVRVPGAWSPFEVIVRAIVGQQVSVKGATTIMGRIASRFGTPVEGAPVGGPSLLFPTPESMAEGDFVGIGMPTRRAAALQIVARAFADRRIAVHDASTAERFRSIKQALVELPGIGPWTAEYFALRALRDADAWPGTDLGLLRSMSELGGSATVKAMTLHSERWRPWRAYAAMHLWNRMGVGGRGSGTRGRGEDASRIGDAGC